MRAPIRRSRSLADIRPRSNASHLVQIEKHSLAGVISSSDCCLSIPPITGQITPSHRLEIDVMEGIDKAEALLHNRSNFMSFEVTDSRILIDSQMTEIEVSNLLKDLIQAGAAILRFQKTER